MPFGTVTDTKPGFVKVLIESYETQTDWIPVVSPFTYKNKGQFNLNIDSQVFIVQEKDQFGEIEQVCIGATYNDEDEPPFDSIAKHGFKLPDSETLVLHGEGTNAVRYAELKTVIDEIQSTLNTFVADYNLHVHMSNGPGVVTNKIATAILGSSADSSTIKSDVVKLD